MSCLVFIVLCKQENCRIPLNCQGMLMATLLLPFLIKILTELSILSFKEAGE